MPNELMKTLTIGANTYDLPQKTSDLTNDSGFTTNSGTVTSVRVQATSPVQSSTSTAQSSTLNTTISLADGYGDTKNPYASKTKNYVLAAPSSANGVPSFRALVADDIPSLTKSKISDFPSIPTKTSDLTNDSGFVTSTTADGTYVAKAGDTITGNVIIGRFTGGAVHSPSLRFSSDYGDYLSLGASEDYSYIASYYLQLQANVEMKSGKTFTLASDPTANLQAATKQYVDNAITAAIGAAIGGSY